MLKIKKMIAKSSLKKQYLITYVKIQKLIIKSSMVNEIGALYLLVPKNLYN